ncbi:MAG: hypothetical protein R2744_01195 [Bacteroidales bacterium]
MDSVAVVLLLPGAKEAGKMERWLSSGYHAGMLYLARNREKRYDPGKLVENARSVIVLLAPYNPGKRRAKLSREFQLFPNMPGGWIITWWSEKLNTILTLIRKKISGSLRQGLSIQRRSLRDHGR